MHPQPDPTPPPSEESKPHWIQRLMDNHWLLLVLGIVLPFLSYTIWGWVELANIPPATLP